MRLDKLLEETHGLSRKNIKRIIQAKRVMIENTAAISPSQVVDAVVQTIVVDGKKINYDKEVYYMLNKPSGVVSAVKDAKHQTVVDCIATPIKGLYPIGRLDRDTKGLILLTNNGPLGFKLLHPKYHVEKVYEVVVNAYLTPADCLAFQKGIVFLDGTVCKAAQLTIISASAKRSVATVSLSEGKFHQVKKMFLSIGKKVIALKRIRFAGISLDETLQEGEYRLLTPEEIKLLLQHVVE